MHSNTALQFDKELLPPPTTFYTNELGKLRRPSRGWARGNCPFHESRSKLSFAVNVESGGFYCFGCGVKGGDVIDFVRLRYKLTFPEAVAYVGALREGPRPELVRTAVGRDLVLKFSINGRSLQARVYDDPKDEVDLLRRIHAEAADRLRELHYGAPEDFVDEAEGCWSRLANSWELLQIEVGR